MDPNMLNCFLLQTPPPFLQSTVIQSPIASIPIPYNNKSPSQQAPTVKQTWEEFCLEQEQQRVLTRPFLTGIRQFGPTSFTINHVPSPFRLPGTVTMESFSPQTSNARSHSGGNTNRWQSRNNFKRSRESPETESSTKPSKKRKKPLSQNVPIRKEWSLVDAERALAIERECNKRSKTALIIKFPDLDLNKQIVAAFHPDIENVHFQQPSTPRFCFVTLKDSANPDEVITTLNQHKFGDNYLVVEHKKDKEEDQAVSARDLDPYTLYVGNLAQEITKEDMVQLYPSSKRIDIGYAKKMKYTRYAFVVFHSIDEAMESFKKTHNQEIYNKSLIVRFRRLHGTVGMPGDNKQQNLPKPTTPEKKTNSQSVTDDLIEVSHETTLRPFTINVKQESLGELFDYDEEDGLLHDDEDLHETTFNHHPKSIKLEVKTEPEVYEYLPGGISVPLKSEFKKELKFTEPEFIELSDVDLEPDLDSYPQDDDFECLYQNIANQRKQASSMRSTSL